MSGQVEPDSSNDLCFSAPRRAVSPVSHVVPSPDKAPSSAPSSPAAPASPAPGRYL